MNNPEDPAIVDQQDRIIDTISQGDTDIDKVIWLLDPNIATSLLHDRIQHITREKGDRVLDTFYTLLLIELTDEMADTDLEPPTNPITLGYPNDNPLLQSVSSRIHSA